MTDAASVDAASVDAASVDAASVDAASVEASAEPPSELATEAGSAGTAAAPTGTDATGRPWPPFAHGSETEMARILDFYGVRWEYEPRTFPILWNLDGDVVESFSPDFYLPDLDLFLEMTTLKQRLVRKKNRKLRRLRELYPDVRIKLFYARDFRAMMLKYGRLALADSLSGTLGQVMPDRGREPDVELAADAIEAAAAATAAATASPEMPAPASHDGPVVAAAPATRHEGPGIRRNASRSRRRRAAAAARAAAREASPSPAGPTTDIAEEVRRPR